MKRLSKRSIALVGTALLVVGWLALNAIVSTVNIPLRVDFTEGSLYTLSPATKAMLQSLDEPVRIDFFYSAEGAKDIPVLSNHALRVHEFLDELARVSHGRVDVRHIDPLPYSQAEDAATSAGMAPITVDGAGRKLILGVLVSGSTDRREAIPYLNSADEAYLEYDISRAIISVSRATHARVALITALPMDSDFNPQSRQMAPPWQVLSQLRTLFHVEVVAPDAEKLPDSFDVLVIAHPKGLSEKLLRAIDQYAVNGGAMLLFLDPYCESDVQPSSAGGYGAGGGSSDLGTLPHAWGIAWESGDVVADRTYAQRVRARSQGGLATVDFVAWLLLTKDAILRNDPAFAPLQNIVMLSAGEVAVRQGSLLEMTPLIESSSDSMLIDASKLGSFADPAALLREFKSDNRTRTIAARFTGMVTSAYPRDAASDAAATDATNALSAAKPATIVVVADADLLRNEAWTQEERLGSLSLGWRPFADNASLLLNSVEQLCGDSALLSLRSRAGSQRPFDVVRELQRAAEDRYRVREQELQARIKDAQKRINDLQQQKTPDQLLILTPEQEAQLGSLQQEASDARTELRQVEFGLREEVEALGHRLMLLNVIAWPACVAVVALGLGLRRKLWRRSVIA
ncbi:MAG: hypothetical protein EXS15_07475 [Phycisphaerales bacterium]|nr:hypothetical protein [Phycisphaerales bacterium]